MRSAIISASFLGDSVVAIRMTESAAKEVFAAIELAVVAVVADNDEFASSCVDEVEEIICEGMEASLLIEGKGTDGSAAVERNDR